MMHSSSARKKSFKHTQLDMSFPSFVILDKQKQSWEGFEITCRKKNVQTLLVWFSVVVESWYYFLLFLELKFSRWKTSRNNETRSCYRVNCCMNAFVFFFLLCAIIYLLYLSALFFFNSYSYTVRSFLNLDH